jgi:catechol 2,3-dioxygenase-like lactoylglutathione lyase family enzyme
MKFSSIALVVSDAKKSAKWFEEKLGFEIRSKDGHWVAVSQKGMPIVIHLCADLYPLEPGISGFGFVCKDVAKEQKVLEAKGVKFTQPTKKEAWGIQAMFADPDGNEFSLTQE